MTAMKLEERLEELRHLRTASPETDVAPILRKALSDRSNLIVAEAAKIAGELHCARLAPDLLVAFDRLFKDPAKTDAKCWGKTAIVRALTVLDHGEATPFLRAAAHIQMEPVWGGQEDFAVHLRASAVLALVQCTDLTRSEVLRHLVDVLADSADTVRIEAVRALEQMNGEESATLLRLKAHLGDKRTAVVGQVFDSLLRLERERAVEFVGRFLGDENPEVRDEAALSLGSSRLTAAVQVLVATWGKSRSPEFSSVLLRALSASRQEAALQFLLNLVRDGITRDSTLALEALALHSDSPEIQARVDQAKRDRTL